MPAIFDTHCHYNLEPLFDEWQKHWQAAQAKGVQKSLVIGTDLRSNERAVAIATAENNLPAAVGLHPTDVGHEVMSDIDDAVANLATLLKESDRIIAIGETGLDYFRLEDASREIVIEQQQRLFQLQIALANEHHLPLIIHVRDRGEQAYNDVLIQLKARSDLQQAFVLHCVSGPLQYIKAALELGAYLGVAGNVTYKNADAIRDIVRVAPKDRLVLETDAPFLPPVPYRGQDCEPWMISETGSFLAEEMGVDPDQLWENAVKLFG